MDDRFGEGALVVVSYTATVTLSSHYAVYSESRGSIIALNTTAPSGFRSFPYFLLNHHLIL